jgi:glycosyltransferase involved in cell wall biosynthesis
MPSISIITPTWNRESYLQRVWDGLASQTSRDFEWIVGDDGSSDGTGALVKALAAKSDFPVILVTASQRIGKARIDNKAVSLARGELLVWNDSDDYLLPEAVSTILRTWRSIPDSERGAFVGVTGLCRTEDGKTISTALPRTGQFDISWNDLEHTHRVTGDMVHAVRAAVMKCHPFEEADFYVPEGSVWSAVGSAMARIVPEPWMVKEYKAANAVSFTGLMEYNRGRAYAVAASERNLRHIVRPLSYRLWRLLTFVRYSIHGDLSLLQQMRVWKGSRLLVIALWPSAALLAASDRLRGTVRKTHIDFDKAKDARIAVERVN